jgi:hypothetical protein
MNPESRNVGIKVLNMAIWLAISWLFEVVEIMIPIIRAATRNTEADKNKNGRLPLSGTSNKNTDIKTAKIRSKNPMTK